MPNFLTVGIIGESRKILEKFANDCINIKPKDKQLDGVEIRTFEEKKINIIQGKAAEFVYAFIFGMIVNLDLYQDHGDKIDFPGYSMKANTYRNAKIGLRVVPWEYDKQIPDSYGLSRAFAPPNHFNVQFIGSIKRFQFEQQSTLVDFYDSNGKFITKDYYVEYPNDYLEPLLPCYKTGKCETRTFDEIRRQLSQCQSDIVLLNWTFDKERQVYEFSRVS